ncbi:hypothetical protein AB1Y20_009120 [Prymnesium parvum]|uniref:RING-type domain-containing protein n=1 Tax=Prymnesium parvum TaxID=97485 RepID=A0AB34K158_PRYPA
MMDDAAHQGLERLVSDRERELQLLRAVAAVQKGRPSLERELRSLIAGGSHASENDDEAPTRPASEQAVTASEEINSLAASRRVSGITSAFRRSLETVFGAAPTNSGRPTRSIEPVAFVPRPAAQAGRRPRSQHANQSVQPRQAVRSRPQNSDDIVEEDGELIIQVPHDAAQDIETTPTPPIVAISRETNRGELRELQRTAMVGRRLRDPTFTARLERMLRTRLSDPDDRRTRDLVMQSISEARMQHRVRAPARGAPPAPVEQAETNAGNTDLGSLHNLNMVTGATFELLLSIQRTLQQDLAAALHNSDRGQVDTRLCAGPDRPTTIGQSQPTTTPPRLGACVVCCEAEVNTVFYKCGHLCACARCAHNLRSRRATCPICRAPVRDVIQVFLACATSSD